MQHRWNKNTESKQFLKFESIKKIVRPFKLLHNEHCELVGIPSPTLQKLYSFSSIYQGDSKYSLTFIYILILASDPKLLKYKPKERFFHFNSGRRTIRIWRNVGQTLFGKTKIFCQIPEDDSKISTRVHRFISRVGGRLWNNNLHGLAGYRNSANRGRRKPMQCKFHVCEQVWD